MNYYSNLHMIHLSITKDEAKQGSHQGQCYSDIIDLMKKPRIKKQLDKLDPEKVKSELAECGAWDEQELSDHEANLQRFLWIACGDINEGNY